MKELIELQKILIVGKDQSPSNNRYKYRKVDDILRAVKSSGIDNVFILLSDELIELNGCVYTKGTATINNGETSVSASAYAKEGALPGQSDPQISGSCSTYARKKALEGLFALDDGNDPDGNPIPENKKKPEVESVSYATPIQKAKLKDYLAEFRNKAVPSAVTYIEDALGDRKLTTIEADKIINHCKIKLETV
jgi:hypothetical protein